ncbi:MAG: type II secretion system protein [Opitutales bacterium]
MSPKSSKRGFTLVEIAAVVALIGIMLAIAVPLFKTHLESAQNAKFMADLRTFSGAFETYRTENGAWPPDQPRDQSFPSGMESYLEGSGWEESSSLGGSFFFDSLRLHSGVPWPAVISIGDYSSGTAQVPVRASPEQLAAIDQAIDDGNLSTGNFRQGFQNMPILILDGTYASYQAIAKEHDKNGTSAPSW